MPFIFFKSSDEVLLELLRWFPVRVDVKGDTIRVENGKATIKDYGNILLVRHNAGKSRGQPIRYVGYRLLDSILNLSCGATEFLTKQNSWYRKSLNVTLYGNIV